MSRVRVGPSLREFLSYYVLVLLAEKRRTLAELVDEIKIRSGENRSYRTNGVLRVSIAEMERVIYSLAHRGWVRPRPPRARWGITTNGRRARQEVDQQFRGGSDSKPRATSELVARLKDMLKGSYVLDVGTGEGFLARRLAKRGFRVLGVDSGVFDYSKDSIKRARQATDSDDGRLEFLQADVTQLIGPRDGFDLVVSSQAIHCMEKQGECVEAIYRLLRSGGRFVALDFLVGLEGFKAHGFHCFLAMSREEWTELLSVIGFVDIKMQKVKDYLIVDAQKPPDRQERVKLLARDQREGEQRGTIPDRGWQALGDAPKARTG